MTKISVKFVRLQTSDYKSEYCFPEEFMKYCQQCGNYGNNHSCPPYEFDTGKELEQYQYAHVICAKVVLNQDEIEVLPDAKAKYVYGKNIIRAVRRQLDTKLLELEGRYPGSKGFYAGSCMECEECARMYQQPCPHPENIRPSLEAYGFDLARTSEELFGVKMLWSDDYLPPYYTLICGFLTSAEIADFADQFAAQ